MPTIRTENPLVDVSRYLRHWTNPGFVGQELASRHKGMPAEIRRRKAREVAVCVAQGLEYMATSKSATILTRPLSLFYAHENLAKATAVFLDPALRADDFKSHGLRHDSSRRYSIKNLQARITSPSRDVWSRYAAVANKQWAIYKLQQEGRGIQVDLEVSFRPPPGSGTDLKIGELALQIPEVVDDVILAGWGTPRVVHVSSYSIVESSGPPITRRQNLTLRHRHHQPTHRLILNRLSALENFEVAEDSLDVIRVTEKDPAAGGLPAFVMDVFGEPYVDFNTARRELAEPLVFLALLFILSSVVRYEPEQWQRLLDSRPAEAILVERLLDLATRKVPNLTLNALHEQYFHFTTGGD